MAPRKPASKKAKSYKPKPPEEVVIDGVAKEIDPSDPDQVKTKPKPKAAQPEAKADERVQRASPLMMGIALIGMLGGLTGAGLGGLAYIKVMQADLQKPQLDEIRALVQGEMGPKLNPLKTDLERLKVTLAELTAPDQEIQDILLLVGDLDRKINALSQQQHHHDGDIAAVTTHQHDELVDRATVDAAIQTLRTEINALTQAAEDAYRPEAASQQPSQQPAPQTSGQDQADQGWWGNVLNAFSISRIDDSKPEGGE